MNRIFLSATSKLLINKRIFSANKVNPHVISRIDYEYADDLYADKKFFEIYCKTSEGYTLKSLKLKRMDCKLPLFKHYMEDGSILTLGQKLKRSSLETVCYDKKRICFAYSNKILKVELEPPDYYFLTWPSSGNLIVCTEPGFGVILP